MKKMTKRMLAVLLVMITVLSNSIVTFAGTEYSFVTATNGGRLILTDQDGDTMDLNGVRTGSVESGQTLGTNYANANETFVKVTKACTEFLGWTVYTADGIAVEGGLTAAPSVQSDQKSILCDTWYDEDEGVTKYTYAVLTNAVEIAQNMSTDSLHAEVANTNYFAIANWGNVSHENIETREENYQEEDRTGSYDKVTVCRTCGTEIARETITFDLYDVMLEGYGAEFSYDILMWNEETEEEYWGTESSGAFGTRIRDYQTLGENLSGYWELISEPERSDADFEGWAKFQVEEIVHEDGTEVVHTFVPKSETDPYYTIEEVMNEKVDCDTIYAAKWSDIEIEEYFTGSGESVKEIVFGANGGAIAISETNLETGETEEGKTGGFGIGFPSSELTVGEALTEMQITLKDVVREGYDFAGWKVYKTDMIVGELYQDADEPLPELEENHTAVVYNTFEEDGIISNAYLIVENAAEYTEILSTEDLMNLAGDSSYVAVAVWTEIQEAVQQRVNQSELTDVPEEIQEQYASIEEVKAALEENALRANVTFSSETANKVFLDVTLQYLDENGKWVDVTPENFPKEGVEVVLAYPEGTNKDNFDFIVAHMISSGTNAGKVEILPYTLTEDGLKVKFTSMSPVMIMYQEKTVESGDTNGTTIGTTTGSTAGTTTIVTTPNTGDSANTWLYAAMLMAAAFVVVSVLKKKNRMIQ